jgi:dipeptidyl aminopeptidase/acylaminoacyl peptidase
VSEQVASAADWTPETSLTVKGVGPVRVSPNGRRAAFTVTEPVMTDEKSEFVAQIWLANTDGSDAYQATFGEKSAENPRWSPDGRFLAFTSKRGEKSRLYVMRLAGGEAEALTDGKSDVGDMRWSPDSRSIAFVMGDAPPEDDEKRKKARDDWSWHEEELKYSRLYVVAVETDADGKREPRLLTRDERHVGAFDWSPDGRQIAFDHAEGPSADLWTTASISLADVATGEVRPFAEGQGAASRPRYSPDGRSIAFARTGHPARWFFQSDLYVAPISGGEARKLPASFDEAPNLVGWTADGRRLLFQEAYHTTSRLYSVEIESGSIETLYSGGSNGEFSLNADRTWIGFPHQTPDQAVEAYASPLEGFAPRQISSVNTHAAAIPAPTTETIRWMGAEGREIEGLLTFPAGYRAGVRVPLLLVIHGGPAGVFSENYTAAANHYPVASFAARGFAVLRCNPRGSSGYGAEFRQANWQDWGGKDFQDLMTGVDRVIEKGIADPDRLGVMGWSYGGFMTSWVLTQTSRFKAASVGAAVTNLVSFNGTADIPSFIPDYFGAEFWHDPQVYLDHSPVFQAKGVTTPTLIQHGDADTRVPISQGFEYYNALKRQGVETRMIVLPRQPHGISEPRMLLKTMQTNLEWFEQHLKG